MFGGAPNFGGGLGWGGADAGGNGGFGGCADAGGFGGGFGGACAGAPSQGPGLGGFLAGDGGACAGGGYGGGGGFGGEGGQQQRFASQQTLTPVTARMLLDSVKRQKAQSGGMHSGPDAPFEVNGRELAMVTIVGCVESVKHEPVFRVYKISDGTGKISLQMYDDNQTSRPADEIKVGDYIRAFGHLRAWNGTEGLSCHHVVKVSSTNEIAHHGIEVAHVHLSMTGKIVKPAAQPRAQPAAGGMPGGPGQQQAFGAPFQQQPQQQIYQQQQPQAFGGGAVAQHPPQHQQGQSFGMGAHQQPHQQQVHQQQPQQQGGGFGGSGGGFGGSVPVGSARDSAPPFGGGSFGGQAPANNPYGNMAQNQSLYGGAPQQFNNAPGGGGGGPYGSGPSPQQGVSPYGHM